MGVLESMRSSSDSTGMQVVLVLIVISFVGWMALPQGEPTVPVAKVNGVPIMDTAYRQLYSNVKYQRERQLDRPLTTEEEDSLGRQVRQQLIRNEVLLQEAEAIGLSVSSYELLWEIVRTGQVAGYADDEGNIDEEKYKRYLARRGLTKGAWETQLLEGLLTQKLRHLVFVGTTISDPILQQIYESNQRKVAVSYVRIRPTDFYASIEVDDAEVDTWLAENGDEARAIYERDFERRYKHPERLNVGVIRLRVEEGQKAADLLPRANAIREALLEGADFADMARKWSEDPSAVVGGEMGLKPVLKIAVDVIGAVQDVETGGLTRVIAGEDDVRIYKVIERIEASEDAFEDVKRQIAIERIRQDRAPALALDFAKQELLPTWKASGEVPTELLERHGLRVQTSGLIAATDPPSPFGPPVEVIGAAIEQPEGTVVDEVFESGGIYWVAQVKERKEADLSLFESQRATIRNQELLTRRQQFLESWITAKVAEADVEE